MDSFDGDHYPFAVRTGLEPATLGVTGRYSNQLNYRTSVGSSKEGCKYIPLRPFAKPVKGGILIKFSLGGRRSLKLL